MALGRISPKASAADSSAYDAAAQTAKDVAAQLDTERAKLAELESRLDVASLDMIGDPSGFSKLEGEVSTARARVNQLVRAKEEAEKRRDDAEHRMKLANNQKMVRRALDALAARDAAGHRVQDAIAVLAKEYEAMTEAASKAHQLMAGLVSLPERAPGMALAAGELARLTANEEWRTNSSLPGSERPVRTGSPEPWHEKNAPTLVENLKDATALAASILNGDRDYAGRSTAKPTEAPKPSKWQMPWRHKNDAEIDAAREKGAAPIDAKRAREAHEVEQAELLAGVPKPLPGESEAAWLDRVSRPERMSQAEREALHRPPTGPTKSAEQIQAEINAAGKYSTVIDARGAKPKEDW